MRARKPIKAKSEDSQEAIDQAWERELDRREAEILSGRVKLLTHEEVMTSLRAATAERPNQS